LIKALASTLRFLVYLKNALIKLAKLLSKPLKKIGRFLLLIIILPLYKTGLSTKKLINKFYAPQKRRHRLIHPFSRRYLSHVILIILSALTVASNLNAYETRRENFGQTWILAYLVTNEDLGDVTEEGPITNSTKVTNYLGQNAVVAKPQVSEEEEGLAPQTAVGGSAIVQQILSPVAEEQASQRGEIIYYTVQNGDTISSIAKQFGVTSNTILWENNLTAYSLIRPGDKLTILPTSGIKHKIVKGENLAKIAKKYGIDAQSIIEFNKLASADDIRIGETLIIPGGKKIIATQPVYSYTAPTKSSTKVVSSGKMSWPNGCRRISQYYGWRHSGVDIACPYGTPIYAANSGRVIKAQGGWNGGYGNETIIDHGNGTQTLYGHQSVIYVKVGQYVEKGQQIGAEGSTGRSTGPHLHFEVRVGGVRTNPLYYIK